MACFASIFICNQEEPAFLLVAGVYQPALQRHHQLTCKNMRIDRVAHTDGWKTGWEEVQKANN